MQIFIAELRYINVDNYQSTWAEEQAHCHLTDDWKHFWTVGLTHWNQDNCHHFAGDIFICNFVNEKVWISTEISLKRIPRDLIENKSSLFQATARRQAIILAYWRIFVSLGINKLILALKTESCHYAIFAVLGAWWSHQMGTIFALLALCAGKSPDPGEFTTQRPVTLYIITQLSFYLIISYCAVIIIVQLVIIMNNVCICIYISCDSVVLLLMLGNLLLHWGRDKMTDISISQATWRYSSMEKSLTSKFHRCLFLRLSN